MKRRSILALFLVTMLVVSMSLIGCGRKYSNSGNGTNSGTNGGIGTGSGTNGGSGTSSGTSGGSGTNNNAIAGTDGTMRDDINGASDSVRNSFDATGNSLNYTAANFKNEFAKAGYQLKDSSNSMKNYFSGKETDYLAGNDVVRVYEYNSANDLDNDIKRIAPNGLTINGTNANYTRMPNYYRKGNSLIVYEGNEPAYTDQFKTMYGNPVIP